MNLCGYRDFDDARQHMSRFLGNLYNVKRIHSSLDSLTPQEFEAQWQAKHPPPTTTTT